MIEQTGKKRLEALQRRWKAEGIAYCLLVTLAVAVPLTTVLHAGAGWPIWTAAPIVLLCSIGVLLLLPYWRLTLTDTSRYLNRLLPELEESCGLLLLSPSELGPLEKLQAARTAEKLGRLPSPHPLHKKLLTASLLLTLAVLTSLVTRLSGKPIRMKGTVATVPATAAVGQKPALGVRAVTVRITPPAYTGHPMRQQSSFSLRVEEGAILSWKVETTAAADTLQFIFNDTARLSLQPANAGRTLWRLTEQANRSGYYQVRTGSQLSELYRLEVVRDEPPQVTIRTPKPYTVLDYGESTTIPLTVTLKDDYGIADAAILAIISSGKGEAVKFKEQEIRWDRNFTGETATLELRKMLDLAALGLKPGDELYFYCRAKDNHGQEGRTEMYIISLTDTAQLMSLEGMTMAADSKPEFFRSERQIIIETEQLLKEKDSIPITVFHNRSNGLGLDQKLLRLRYGKFLGEEAEEGDPGSSLGDTTSLGAFGDATRILDIYTDKHDNAEDASFFEPAVKQQLRATLSEMWKAELQLRTNQPREALPYAYKALRLLKDLQQQSRAYVAKTGMRVTPLNLAKRLTGDLTAIQPPLQLVASSGGLPENEVLRMVLGELEGWRVGQGLTGQASLALLQPAARRLGREAAARPGEYLAAYQDLRRMIDGVGGTDIPGIERAIRKLLPAAEAVPAAGSRAADAGLSQLYFHHLNEPAGRP